MSKRVATYYFKTTNKDGTETRTNVSRNVFLAVVIPAAVVLILAIVLVVKFVGAVLGFIGIPMWVFWVTLVIWFISSIKLSFDNGEEMKIYQFLYRVIFGTL